MSFFRRALLLACLAPAFAHAAPPDCGSLKHRVFAPSEIALPTRGAVIASARHIVHAGPGFCKVMGKIVSLDPSANPVRFEVNLPDTWNGKAVQFGGGAFNGWLHQSDGLGQTVVGDKNETTPLARGYLTFGSDSGHHHRYIFLPDIFNALNPRFGLNDEERRNFASESLKKTHDVAVALARLYYGNVPRRMYFVGGSTGGREAMMVIDRWPADYDGVLAAYAAWNQIESDLQYIRISQAMYAKGGYLPFEKSELLRNAVMKACDAQDGLSDGIVGNPAACVFDPATLRCPTGASQHGCLSNAELKTVDAFAEPTTSSFAVEHGMTFEPGFNVLRGADLTGNMGLCRHPMKHPFYPFNSFYYLVADGVLRDFLKDKRLSALTFDWQSGGSNGQFIPAIREQSAEDDASLADLTPFAAHGGKLILVHGTADTTIPTDASVLLYNRIVAAMGQPAADSFLRLYLIPGFGHAHGVFNAGFDTVGALDAWADRQQAPTHLAASDQNLGATRARPLCAYPSWPRYDSGDPNLAASFHCEAPRSAQ
jgi:feruloyl esterase